MQKLKVTTFVLSMVFIGSIVACSKAPQTKSETKIDSTEIKKVDSVKQYKNLDTINKRDLGNVNFPGEDVDSIQLTHE